MKKFKVTTPKEKAISIIMEYLLDNPELHKGNSVFCHYTDDNGMITLHDSANGAGETITTATDELDAAINCEYKKLMSMAEDEDILFGQPEFNTDVFADAINSVFPKFWSVDSAWLKSVADYFYDKILSTYTAGEIVTLLRSELHMSRADFSKTFEISVRTLEDWEARKRTPPTYVLNLLRIAVEKHSESN